MGIFGGAPQLAREQAMSARPIRNPNVGAARNDEGEVLLKIPRRRVWWVNLLARFGGVPEFRVVTLDRVGTRVWDLCDGEHAVREIAGTLAGEGGMSQEDAERSLEVYLGQLGQRGLVALKVGEEPSPPQEAK